MQLTRFAQLGQASDALFVFRNPLKSAVNRHQRLHTQSHRPLAASPSRSSSSNTTSLPPSCRFQRSSSTTTTTRQEPVQQEKTSSVLTWNEFLRLRKIRRRFNVAASSSLGAVSFFTGMGILSQQNLEALGQVIFGLDPMFVLGIGAVVSGGTGWMLGPFVGSGIWRLVYRKHTQQVALKEHDFFNRIKKYRVDPTSSSMQNPVPDYYGEKITSVQGYRQWLKDQRAFNKKRQSFV